MSTLIPRIYERLLRTYGPQGWWPADSSFEMMVGAVLTQACTWVNAARAIAALRSADALGPASILALPDQELARLVRPAGYFNAKARKLKALASFLMDRFGGDPAGMSQVPTGRLRQMLLSVHGVGEETADDILVYAANRPVFVVDAYTRRIAARLGLARKEVRYSELSSLFAGAMPEDAQVLGEFHALLVRHAKQTCRKSPRCDECTLVDLCPTGTATIEAITPG